MKSNHVKARYIVPALLAILVYLPAPALAHAALDHAEPKVGSDVARAPTEVRLRFTQAIEPAFSMIEVKDKDGKEVDKKDTHLDPQDKQTLIVSLESLPPGAYTVSWHVVSVDTHRTHGDFKFTVKS
jgi:methionine-rich copper-binding protein CopC